MGWVDLEVAVMHGRLLVLFQSYRDERTKWNRGGVPAKDMLAAELELLRAMVLAEYTVSAQATALTGMVIGYVLGGTPGQMLIIGATSAAVSVVSWAAWAWWRSR